MKLFNSFVLFLLVGVTGASFAQNTGFPPFNDFSKAGGGIDTINLANLNVHLEVPIRSLGAYGPKASVGLVLDTLTTVFTGASVFIPPNPFGVQASTQVSVQNVVRRGNTCATYSSSAQGVLDSHNTYHPTPQLVLSGCRTSGGTTPGADGWSIVGSTGDAGEPNLYAVAPSGDNTWMGRFTTDPHGNTTIGAIGLSLTQSSTGVISCGALTDALGNVVINGTTCAASPTVQLTYPGPNGATPNFTLTFTNKPLLAEYGCPTKAGSPGAGWSLTGITFPDQSTMGFAYEPVYNDSTKSTGRIASVKLRTGATISYDYTGYGTNGINCSDGSTAGFKKTTPDGVWKFAHTAPSGTNQLSTTTVTAPYGGVTTYTFAGLYPVHMDDFYFSTTICYNGNTSSCTNPPTAPTLPITERDVYSYVTQVTNPALKVYLYDGYSRLTDVKTYDFGGVRGGTNYATEEHLQYGSYVSNGDYCASQTEVVQGVSVPIIGLVCADQKYSPGAPIELDGSSRSSYATGTADLTTRLDLVGGAFRPTTIYYDSFGRVTSVGGPNGESNTVSYSQCSGKMPYEYSHKASGTTTLYEAVTVTDCIGEVAKTIYDFNNQYVRFDYGTDPLWRPISFRDQAGTITSFTYSSPTSTSPASTTISTPITSSSVKEFVETLDSMGRKHVVQQRLGPSSTQYSSVETDYDANGRVSRTTIPYQAALGGTNGGVPSNTYLYDDIDRLARITSPVGAVEDVTYYAGPAARETRLRVYGTSGTAKSVQYEYNGLDQVTSACEITNMAGAYNCNQSAYSANGFRTSYSYSGSGNLLSIVQNVGGSSTQTRSFTYENGNTGRLLTKTTPESGTVSFTYDYDSTCGTFIGAVVKTVDNGGGTTCLHYDLLGRVTSKNYSGFNVGNTPSRTFIYDITSNPNIQCGTVSNNGRLVEVITTDPLVGTDEGFCYDVVGNPHDTFTWIGGTTWDHASESYFPTGIPQTLAAGNQIVNYGLDSMGRIYSATASPGQNPLTSVAYNIANQPTTVTFGSGDSSTYNWLFPSGPLSSSSFAVGASAVANTLTWNGNGTLQKLVTVDPLNTANSQTCTYSYDDLSRLSTDNCGSGWNQAFSYDPFGNVTKTGSVPWPSSGTYNSSNNRYSSPAFAYDANGRLTNDTFGTMGWDIEGNMVTQSGATHAYDGLNRYAGEAGPTFSNYIHAPDGGLLATADGNGVVTKMYIPLPMSSAVYNGNGTLSHYRRYDFQGSVRVASTPSKTKYSDTAYGAFGEPYGATGTSNAQYAGLTSDIPSGTEQVSESRRYHPTQGRWVSPDSIIPNIFNPQSLNSYAYVTNNPLGSNDPSGHGDNSTVSSGVASCSDPHIMALCQMGNSSPYSNFPSLTGGLSSWDSLSTVPQYAWASPGLSTDLVNSSTFATDDGGSIDYLNGSLNGSSTTSTLSGGSWYQSGSQFMFMSLVPSPSVLQHSLVTQQPLVPVAGSHHPATRAQIEHAVEMECLTESYNANNGQGIPTPGVTGPSSDAARVNGAVYQEWNMARNQSPFVANPESVADAQVVDMAMIPPEFFRAVAKSTCLNNLMPK
jgi:RHS repeat-associated protein